MKSLWILHANINNNYVVIDSVEESSNIMSGLVISSQISQGFIQLPENGTVKLKFSLVCK